MVSDLTPRDLLQLQLFEGENPGALQWLLERAAERRLKTGEVLLAPDQENRSLYILLDGILDVELEAEERTFVIQVTRGECVGELSVLDGQPTAARVVAAEPAHVMEIGREVLLQLIGHSHAVARNLLFLLASRIRKNDAALSDSFLLQQHYARSARIDSLTGLYNRYWLDEMLPRLVERAQIDGSLLGLLMFDVDHFKRFNDEQGHLAGDEALRVLSSIVRTNLRPNDSAVRYGGEEFVIILPGLALEGLLEAAERLRSVVQQQSAAVLGRHALPGVRISIGVALLEAGEGERALIGRADEALYRAKRGGRDRVEA